MNASLSDENEPVIDIFILSANSPLSAQLEKQLRDEGYYVTLFSDGSHLLETLRNGKPNLLMCDTTVPDADAFEVCRQIKADDFLWNIPVLIITGAFDLADLLRVLDCNADNFIAHPFDPPYLLSLVEGMLTVPVERQTPEQIKTQFKIKHDDQVFVVTADRRKLLEFLLSSFEIAVNKSADLSRAQEDNRNLGTTIRRLEETVQENTKVIGIINESVKSKDQKLSELTSQLSDREQTIRDKIAAADQLSGELAAERSALQEARDEVRRISQEKDESQAAHQTTIDQLQRQVTDLSSELAIVKPALERANGELVKESAQRSETSAELSTTKARKEQLEKALSSLTTEFEQLKITAGTEKSRAEDAENELRSVLQAKNQSEQDLTGIINDLKATATQQASVITRMKEDSAAAISRLQEELDAERSRAAEERESGLARLRQAEEALDALATAKEESEASLQSTINERQKYLLDLQAWLDTAKTQLEEKDRKLGEIEGELAATRSARESAEKELSDVSRALAETTAAREAGDRSIASQKEDLTRLFEEKERADALAETLSQSVKDLQASLEQEKTRSRENEERMNMIILQRDRELGELRTAHDDTRTALSSNASALGQLQEELASSRAAGGELEEKLRRAEERIGQLSQDLANASGGREEDRRQIISLSGQLEQVQASLENETRRRQELEDNLRNSLSRQQQAEQVQASLENETRRRQEAEDSLRDSLSQQQQMELDIERLVAETKTLHADLIAERRLHGETAELARSLEDRAGSLEKQAAALQKEKSDAERAAADLTAEIDQARVALADEWEDHMTDNERLAAVPEKRPESRPAPYSGVRREAEIIKKRSLIVKVPGIPHEIRPLPRSMVAVDPVKTQEPERSGIQSVEDLFEDDDTTSGKSETPKVSIIREPDTEPVRDVLPDSLPGTSRDRDSFFEENGTGSPDEDEGEDADTGDEGDHDAASSGREIAFNRTQWLDLLKWSHHCDALSQEQRLQIVRMGRLIQKGRKLTGRQEEQVMEMVALVRKLGYRFP